MSEINFDVINARVTFKNVPHHILSRFRFKDLNIASETFKTIPGVVECIIIQTTSRIEIFTVSNLEIGDTVDGRRIEGKSLILNQIKEKWQSLSELEQIDIDHFDQTLEVYKGNDVYLNLLRLSCGLDSLIVGTEEILNEIKASLSHAKQINVSGSILNKLFESVTRIATRIRETTGISKDVISLGDVAVKIVDEKTGLDAKKQILLIGTGESAAMVAKTLNKKGYSFDVTSKTIERSTGFSKILGGKLISFEDVLTGFDKYDIIFVATTCDYFLITFDKIKLVMEAKKKGTLILDLSNPRTVNEDITLLPGIKLLFKDQIVEIYDENIKSRIGMVPAVEKIIEKEVIILEAIMKRITI